MDTAAMEVGDMVATDMADSATEEGDTAVMAMVGTDTEAVGMADVRRPCLPHDASPGE